MDAESVHENKENAITVSATPNMRLKGTPMANKLASSKDVHQAHSTPLGNKAKHPALRDITNSATSVPSHSNPLQFLEAHPSTLKSSVAKRTLKDLNQRRSSLDNRPTVESKLRHDEDGEDDIGAGSITLKTPKYNTIEELLALPDDELPDVEMMPLPPKPAAAFEDDFGDLPPLISDLLPEDEVLNADSEDPSIDPIEPILFAANAFDWAYELVTGINDIPLTIEVKQT